MFTALLWQTGKEHLTGNKPSESELLKLAQAGETGADPHVYEYLLNCERDGALLLVPRSSMSKAQW